MITPAAKAVRPLPTTVLDGWDIHRSPGSDWPWTLWGFDCVDAYLRRGRRGRVGIDDPQRLATLLKERGGERSWGEPPTSATRAAEIVVPLDFSSGFGPATRRGWLPAEREPYVRVSRYAEPQTVMGVAMAGQPVPQHYFHRPLSHLLGTFLAAGFVLDERNGCQREWNKQRARNQRDCGEPKDDCACPTLLHYSHLIA